MAAEDLREEDHLEIDALQRNIKSNFQQVVSLSPLLSDDLQALAANITDPGKLADFIASSLATIGTPVKQEVLGDARHPGADGLAQPDPDQGARSPRARLEDPVAGPVRGRQEPARVLPARAAQGDSEGARRRRRAGQGDRGAAHEDRGPRHARPGQEGSAARARAPVEDAGGGRRVHGLAHLSGLDRGAAVVEAHRGFHRSRSAPRTSSTPTTQASRRSRIGCSSISPSASSIRT